MCRERSFRYGRTGTPTKRLPSSFPNAKTTISGIFDVFADPQKYKSWDYTMPDDDDEMPQLPIELSPGWRPGDMLPQEDDGGGDAPGLLARAGMAAPDLPSTANESGAGEESGDGVAIPREPGLYVHPFFQATIGDMRKRSPTFDSMLKTLEQSSKCSSLFPSYDRRHEEKVTYVR